MVNELGLGLAVGAVAAIVAFGLSPFLLRGRRIRKRIQRGVAAYEAGDAAAVVAVHRCALSLLRNSLEAHRRRTLGPRSEWERARTPLAEAVDEVEGRVAYWDERLRGDSGNELATLQLKTARSLRSKLRSALEEVDGRANALRQFYHRCEAKLAAMDRSTSDLVEVKRLEALSGKAEAVIAHAHGTIEALASQFLAEAQKIADALGSTNRSQLGRLAGDAPLDNIEYLADKINESSERDRTTIEALERTLAG